MIKRFIVEKKKTIGKTRHRFTMATNEFKDAVKDTVEILKKLSFDVPETSNSSDFYKFLIKTVATAKTFDKESKTYVDYVAKAISKKKVPGEKKQALPLPEKKENEKKVIKDDDKDGEEEEIEVKKKKVVKEKVCVKVPIENTKKRPTKSDQDESPDAPAKKKVKTTA